MIAQIQTYFSYFFGKLVALALFLFILTSFNLQIVTANAQATTPAPKPAATDTAKTPAPKANSAVYKEDDRIGSLKNCTVNATNGESLKTDPNAANKFIYNCLKDIISIVITISVILAIMRLIFVGIQFLNTFGDEATLQKELAKAITGFVAGAIILGLFAAIINVVNPSALRIDKIFSAQVIADYKCLNKGVSDPNAAKTGAGCKDDKQGSGSGGSTAISGGEQNDLEIKTLLESTKDEDKEKKAALIKEITACDTYIAVNFADQAKNCQKYQDYTNTYTPSTDIVEPKNFAGNVYANGKFDVKSIDGNIAYGTYTIGSGPKPTIVKFAFKFEGKCENSPLKKVGVINRNEQINFDGCIVQLS